METRVCNVCNEEKSLKEFWSGSSFQSLKGKVKYYSKECKSCNPAATPDEKKCATCQEVKTSNHF